MAECHEKIALNGDESSAGPVDSQVWPTAADADTAAGA